MNRFAPVAALLAALAVFAMLAVPAAAPNSPSVATDLRSTVIDNEDGHEPVATAAPDSEKDVVPRVAWMLAGVAASALVLGMLYKVKRAVGGFPENPTWVAPITIMPSSQLPGDGDPHAADSHGHHEAAPGH